MHTSTHMTSSCSIGDSGYAPGLSILADMSTGWPMLDCVHGDGDAVNKDAEVGTAGVTASAQACTPWCDPGLDTTAAFNALHFHHHASAVERCSVKATNEGAPQKARRAWPGVVET